MDDQDYAHKLDELDRLLNDPDVPMQPARVWTLLAELSEHDLGLGPVATANGPRGQAQAAL